MFNLASAEEKLFKKLNTPSKIQDFLDSIPFNFEKRGDTLYSPRGVIKAKTAHCLEGAMFAAAALLYHGCPPLLMDFKTVPEDQDHVVAVFKEGGLWGAISKTNHGILRFRDPVYKSPRELAMSYFHEYYDFNNGKKTMLSYSKPFNLRRFGTKWITNTGDWFEVAELLDQSLHLPVAPKKVMKRLRPVGKTEIKMGRVTEWQA